MTTFRVFTLLAGGLGITVCLPAQVAISTHSGLIQFTVGSVYVGDKPVHKTTTNLPDVKNGQVLRTGSDGNAELLLTPGVFLRLGNDASVRMDSNALSNTQLTLLSGVAMVECDELLEDNAVSFTVGKQVVEFRKKGLFRLEANPPSIAAIKGDAFVTGTLNTTVKHGKELALDTAVPQLQKFHLNKKDDLYLFSQARAEDSAYATNVTASSLYSSGYNCGASSWYLMSSVGMYSYLPCSGMFANPFGAYMLGLNYGYLWNGPNYYVPPMGMIGMPVRGGGGGGGGTVAGNVPNVAATPAAHPGGIGSTPGSRRVPLPGTAHPEAANAAIASRGTSVPVFVGPGYHGAPPRVELFQGAHPYARIMSSNPGFHGNSGMRNMTGSAISRPAMRNMAGPAIAHPTMRSMGGGFHGNPGAMRNGGNFGGARPMGGVRSAPSGGFGGASGASPAAAPSAAPAGGGGARGGPRSR
ncbi:MAG TPA: hypothetical protein VN737_13315 [Bryobacteraceae bacterium]|nr:hypothetical protein [Bryobacteraceae bacterium]